jgi:hypothetical protein
MNDIEEDLHEIDLLIYNLKIQASSEKILKNCSAFFFPYEEWYQNHRIKYSESYFSGWRYNVGESLGAYVRKNIIIYLLLFSFFSPDSKSDNPYIPFQLSWIDKDNKDN